MKETTQDTAAAERTAPAQATKPRYLYWLQPKMARRHYELTCDEIKLAEYQGGGLLRLAAEVIWQNERWQIETEGFLKHTIVFRSGAGEEIARFEQEHWMEPAGWVRIGQGRSYWFRADSSWRTRFAVEGEGGELKIRMAKQSIINTNRMRLTAEDPGVPARDIVVLAAVGLTVKRLKDQVGGVLSLVLPFR